jgi:hypothetical protein
MGMSFKSPLGRLPIKRSKTECKEPIIPDEIRLPDGRVFSTKELLAAKSKREHINLRSKKRLAVKPKNTNTGAFQKYTYGERVWIANATTEAIVKRYPDLRPDYIASFKQQSKDIVAKIELGTDLIYIDNTNKE